MNRRSAIAVALVVFVFIATGVIASICLYRTLTTTGQLAVEAMNSEERTALAQLSSVNRDMSAAQVYQALGPPSEDYFLMAKWNAFGGSIFSQARVYFVNGHPSRIRWLKLGFFMYETAL
jgi:hypothetical protein